ncbi:hypothetical protein [Rhizobium sp. Root651]|uniref:hypothetical protein n=1 Tax=Rhizobium sp. Root651 TaxID=1736577 RepID=UPI00071483CB|nr:hypothetical protein [Rhizobium sp. Root651]KRA65276.1 hypothetical protein ASD85_25290 [Rhizobium sp. Root651]
MTARLAEMLPGGSGANRLRVWLESSGYARRLLLGPEGDPWADGAAKYLSFFSQARGLLRADVAVVPIGDLYRSWIARHPGLAVDMAAKKRATFPLRRMLEEEGPRKLLDEVAEAVAANLQGQLPMVLAMPSPAAWLDEAQRMVGREAEERDDDAVEDAAMYIADFVRCVAARPVGGLLIEEAEAVPGPADRYAPVFNAARHYRWAVVGRGVRPGQEPLFDAVIGGGDGVQGRDVSLPLFTGSELPESGTTQFRYALIPPDHPPEAVLDALVRMRA